MINPADARAKGSYKRSAWLVIGELVVLCGMRGVEMAGS